jgi:MFS family permease
MVLAAAVAAVHVFTRVVPLSMSFTHDEAYTVTNYVLEGPVGIYLGPYIANNHVLFSLVAWVATGVFGPSEAVYRLGGAIPAVAAVGWLSYWTHRRFGPTAAIALATLATAAPLLSRHSVLARGYGIALLASVAMLVLTARFLEHGEARSLRGLGFAGVLGFWTYPLMAPVLAGHLAAIFALRPRSRWRIVGLATITGVAALLIVAPIVPGLLRDAAGLATVPAGLGQGDGAPGMHPLTGLLRQFVPGVATDAPIWIVVAALGVYTCLGILGLVRMDTSMRAIVLAPMAALAGFHLATGVHFAPRFLVPVLLHALLPVAVGGDVVRLAVSRRARSVSRILGIVAVAVTVGLLGRASIAAVQLLDEPLQAPRGVVEMVEASGVPGPVLTDKPQPAGLEYYADRSVEVQDPLTITERACGSAPPPIVVLHTADAGTDACLRERGATVRTFEQQWSRPLTLYLIDASR